MGRKEGIAKARAVRTAAVKRKIQSAITVLTMYQAKITIRAVAEEAGVSINSVQKYFPNTPKA